MAIQSAAKTFLTSTFRYATSSPLRFALSTAFALVLFVHVWSAIFQIALNNNCYQCIPQLPYFSIPLLGHPLAWSLQRDAVGIAILFVLWFGTVLIYSKQSPPIHAQGRRSASDGQVRRVRLEEARKELAHLWSYSNPTTKRKLDDRLGELINVYAQSAALLLIHHFPDTISHTPREFWQVLLDVVDNSGEYPKPVVAKAKVWIAARYPEVFKSEGARDS